MPLMDSTNALKQQNSSNNINNVNLNFYLGNKTNGDGNAPGRKSGMGKMVNSMDNLNKNENILPSINNINYAK